MSRTRMYLVDPAELSTIWVEHIPATFFSREKLSIRLYRKGCKDTWYVSAEDKKPFWGSIDTLTRWVKDKVAVLQ